jgi:radical SAM protein with 4Fe4S-binding SPASM domain
LQEKDEWLNMIKKAFIEITNVCNLSCDFCPGTSRSSAFMAEEGFATVLGKLTGKVQCLYFHLMGEPLLHPLVGRFLNIAHDNGFPVNLTTNGTLLGRVGEALLNKPALRQVNISLHSRTADGAAGDYLEDVLAFAQKARAQGNIIIALRLWNLGGGEPDAGTESVLGRIALEYGKERAELDESRDGRGVKLAQGVYLNRAKSFDWPDINGHETGGTPYCMGLKDQIGILCDGTVVPCCLDSEGNIPLGNIFTQPLEELLASPRAAAVAQGFARREAVEELCRKCGYRRRFG